MKNDLKIDEKILARNTTFNLIGQIIPIGVAVISIPFILRGIGTERFGLLSIALIVLSYFMVFDLGLGRATVKFVAEALSKNEVENVSKIVWSAVTIQIIFGVFGAIILVGITPVLVNHVLKISPEFLKEARFVFYLLAFAVPIILVNGSFSGVLEASQRFDLINAVKIPNNCLTFLLPLIGAILKFNLPIIVLMIIIARFLALAIYFILSIRLFPHLKKYSGSYSNFRQLFSFGGWVMVSSLVSPILAYFDRFLIGSIISMTAVTYYTAPYEAVTRLLIIPASLTMTLFPAFSALNAIKEIERVRLLFIQSLKYVFLLLGPITIIIGVFSNEILHIWLGADFASKSSIVLKIIALGVLINSVAHFPFALLQGVGRPDIPAKFHLIEMIFYIGIVIYLVNNYGINGAAIAWTLRISADALLLFISVLKIYKLKLNLANSREVLWLIVSLIAFGAVNYIFKILGHQLGLPVQITFIVAFLILFFWFVWLRVLDVKDRKLILKIIR